MTRETVIEAVNAAQVVTRLHPLDDPWPDLDPFPDPDEAGTPEPFPLDALGVVLGGAAAAIARNVQAPEALAAAGVLAAASLAFQPLVNVMLPHAQAVPISLFLITSAQSGDRKSRVDQIAGHETERHRAAQARDHVHALREHEREVAKLQKGAGKSADALPAPPLARTLITGNATVEGLFKLLRHQPSVGVFTSEGAEFLGGHSMREERRAAGLSFLLKAWGGEALDLLRGGEGLSVLLGRRVALHALAQPIVLRTLLNDPFAKGQGLLARCLIAEPKSIAGTRMFKAVDALRDDAVRLFHSVIREALGTAPSLHPKGDGYELDPRLITFKGDARSAWIKLYDAVELEQAQGKGFESIRPFASKAAEQAARIAALITLSNDPAAQCITYESIEGASAVVDFYMGEHMRLTQSGKIGRAHGDAIMLLQWMLTTTADQTGYRTIKHADVLQRCPNAVRELKAAGIGALLDELTQRGYVRRVGPNWQVRA